VLLTGATGFVGSALAPRLVGAGWRVRGLTRHLKAKAGPAPLIEWCEGDIQNARDDARALEGVEVAVYLVHAMTEGKDFERREVDEAGRFAEAAREAGVSRIVYLGGVAPQGTPSPHLRSRLAVGETLRRGPVPVIELRASMIIGHGSTSWLIVRDLAARLPLMVLPSWLRSRTQPVAIDDVVVALAAAVESRPVKSDSFDLPGPDVLTGRQILEQTSREMNLRRPLAIEVPLLTPRLSSHWVRFVTRAPWHIARQLVEGLTHDLLARDDRFWHDIGHPERLPFAEAARRALAHERRPEGVWGLVERLRQSRDRLVHV
jgi:uncharacterized protein YbjT (DUF2867 family)